MIDAYKSVILLKTQYRNTADLRKREVELGCSVVYVTNRFTFQNLKFETSAYYYYYFVVRGQWHAVIDKNCHKFLTIHRKISILIFWRHRICPFSQSPLDGLPSRQPRWSHNLSSARHSGHVTTPRPMLISQFPERTSFRLRDPCRSHNSPSARHSSYVTTLRPMLISQFSERTSFRPRDHLQSETNLQSLELD